MGKNKAQAHHTAVTYVHTRVNLTQLSSQSSGTWHVLQFPWWRQRELSLRAVPVTTPAAQVDESHGVFFVPLVVTGLYRSNCFCPHIIYGLFTMRGNPATRKLPWYVRICMLSRVIKGGDVSRRFKRYLPDGVSFLAAVLRAEN